MAGASSSVLFPVGSSSTGALGFGGTGFTASGFSTVFGDIGGLVSGFTGAEGYRAEADAYGIGATLAQEQAAAAEEIGELQKFQLNRKVALSESSTRAAAAQNGLQETGSVADIIRESQIQGAQAEQNITYSTELKADQYREQAAAAEAQAKAANDAGFGSIVGGLFKGAAAAASMFLML